MWIHNTFFSDPDPNLHLISAPDSTLHPASGHLLNMHFFSLTFPFSLSQGSPYIFLEIHPEQNELLLK